MKIKQGFVTNSSSTSFVFLGYEIRNENLDETVKTILSHLTGKDYNDPEMEDDYYNDIYRQNSGVSILMGDEGGAPWKNSILVGRYLASDITDDPPNSRDDQFDIDYINKITEEIRYTLLDIPIKLNKPKIYIGTQLC